jgi:Sec-independent protein translocase protein TatA
MQDLWHLLLIVIFAALIFGLTYGCAALGARK